MLTKRRNVEISQPTFMVVWFSSKLCMFHVASPWQAAATQQLEAPFMMQLTEHISLQLLIHPLINLIF